jgi:hypothetical protein
MAKWRPSATKKKSLITLTSGGAIPPRRGPGERRHEVAAGRRVDEASQTEAKLVQAEVRIAQLEEALR